MKLISKACGETSPCCPAVYDAGDKYLIVGERPKEIPQDIKISSYEEAVEISKELFRPMDTAEQLAREELDRTQRTNAQLAFENERFRKVLESIANTPMFEAHGGDLVLRARAVLEVKANG